LLTTVVVMGVNNSVGPRELLGLQVGESEGDPF
jgi:transposase-like protein